MIISSQRYIDDEIMQEKIENEDYDVLVSPEFELDGKIYQVILDGHHSFFAAKELNIDANLIISTPTDHDAISILNDGYVESFLEVVHMGDDYYDVNTEDNVW